MLFLFFTISLLHKPVYDPLRIYNFKVRDLTIYNSPSMAIVPFAPNDSKGIQLLNLRVGADQRFLKFLFLNSRLISIVPAIKIIYGLITKNIVYRRFSDKKSLSLTSLVLNT